MKTIAILILSVLVGAALGITATSRSFSKDSLSSLEGVSQLSPAADSRSLSEDEKNRLPVVQVRETRHDFGTIVQGGSSDYAFTIKNIGGSPLILEQGETTCKCTISSLSKNSIEPGESAEVFLEWDAKGFDSRFQQSATIFTNDPFRKSVRFTITGSVVPALLAEPDKILLSKVEIDARRQATFDLYSFTRKDLSILGHRFLDTTTANLYTFSWEPLPKKQVQMKKALSGFRCHVTLSPGHPIGRIQQHLLIETNDSESGAVDVSFAGYLVGPISVVGKGWSSRTNRLNLGAISSETGHIRNLMLFVRGNVPEDFQIEIATISSDVLKAELGEAKRLKDSRVVQVPLKIEVPKGSPTVNHLNNQQGKLAEIVIKSNHSALPETKIYVSFAVLSGENP